MRGEHSEEDGGLVPDQAPDEPCYMPAAMPAAPNQAGPLKATLAELASLDALTLPDEPAELLDEGAGLEPLPSFEIPSDRRVVTAREVAAAIVGSPSRAH